MSSLESGSTSDPPGRIFDSILVLDFGSQYSHLITRRLRDIQVYSELQPCTIKIANLPWKPKGIILSGGPYSVYERDAPHVDPAIFDLNLPILGVCYGMQEIAWNFGKDVLAGEKREYGHAKVDVVKDGASRVHINQLLQGLGDRLEVFMSHGDKLGQIPGGFTVIAATTNAPFAGIVHNEKPIYGVQFHPEVGHTPKGQDLLQNFAVKICQAQQHWTMQEFVHQEVERIRTLVGEKGQVIGAVSGGVDSTVAAKLMDTAIGSRFHAVMIDNGLLRKDEARNVLETLTQELGIRLTVVDASQRFLDDLKGVVEPERKRKIIGSRFITEFQKKARELEVAAAGSTKAGPIEWLLQGTLYPDVIESISFKGPSQTIKTHHNVGGLPDFLKLKLIEPLRLLFKDEVRVLGTKLGVPESLVWRHPFPGPGLGIRILGEVNKSQLEIARAADHIFLSELNAHGLYQKTSQAFAALIPTRAVGVMGDKRVYGQMVSLRAVTSNDFMTASRCHFDVENRDFLDHVSSRITNEIAGITRVLYDVTSKPPWVRSPSLDIATLLTC